MLIYLSIGLAVGGFVPESRDGSMSVKSEELK